MELPPISGVPRKAPEALCGGHCAWRLPESAGWRGTLTSQRGPVSSGGRCDRAQPRREEEGSLEPIARCHRQRSDRSPRGSLQNPAQRPAQMSGSPKQGPSDAAAQGSLRRRDSHVPRESRCGKQPTVQKQRRLDEREPSAVRWPCWRPDGSTHTPTRARPGSLPRRQVPRFLCFGGRLNVLG